MAPPECRVSAEARMWWAYRRAIRAMLVTTITDVSAFLSTLICVVPNLISFAIFTALLAVANFALVCTMWPCALLLHERMNVWWRRQRARGPAGMCAPCYFACARPARRVRLAETDSAAAGNSDRDSGRRESVAAFADTPSGWAGTPPSTNDHGVAGADADNVAGGDDAAKGALHVAHAPSPAAAKPSVDPFSTQHDEERLETISLDAPPPTTIKRQVITSYVRSKMLSPSPPASPPEEPPESLATPTPRGLSSTSPTTEARLVSATRVTPHSNGLGGEEGADVESHSRRDTLEDWRVAHANGDGLPAVEPSKSAGSVSVTSSGSGRTPWRNRIAHLSEAFYVAKLSHLWRRTGQMRREMPRGTRLIERFYAEHYAPFLTRGHNALIMLVISACVGCLFGYHALQLRPASRDINVWPDWHNEFHYFHARDTYAFYLLTHPALSPPCHMPTTPSPPPRALRATHPLPQLTNSPYAAFVHAFHQLL